jgi:hypothetical protein
MIKFSINDLRETSVVDLKCIQFVIKEELARRENERRKNQRKENENER